VHDSPAGLWLAALDWVGGLLRLRLRLRLRLLAVADGMRRDVSEEGGLCGPGVASLAVCLDGQLLMLTSERGGSRTV
jgi:hypothetical protein